MSTKQVVLTIIYLIQAIFLAVNVDYFILNLGSAASAGVIIGPTCIIVATTTIYIKLFDMMKQELDNK